MFCPTCGRDNANERKFCSSCGTNLEAVSQVLSGRATNFFTKLDAGFDQLFARYSEHLFKDALSDATDRKVKNSWKLLGKSVVTSLFDLFMAVLIWNVISLRFEILLITTPFRLLSEKFARQKKLASSLERETLPKLAEPPEQRWLAGAAASVSEHTTERLQDYSPPPPERSRPGEPNA